MRITRNDIPEYARPHNGPFLLLAWTPDGHLVALTRRRFQSYDDAKHHLRGCHPCHLPIIVQVIGDDPTDYEDGNE